MQVYVGILYVNKDQKKYIMARTKSLLATALDKEHKAGILITDVIQAEATEWCIDKGCNYELHPQYKSAMKRLTKKQW